MMAILKVAIITSMDSDVSSTANVVKFLFCPIAFAVTSVTMLSAKSGTIIFAIDFLLQKKVSLQPNDL